MVSAASGWRIGLFAADDSPFALLDVGERIVCPHIAVWAADLESSFCQPATRGDSRWGSVSRQPSQQRRSILRSVSRRPPSSLDGGPGIL